MKVTIFIVKFLILGALFIVSNENLYIGNAQDRGLFIDTFNTWLETLFQHSLQIAGYVVDSEWLPQEDSGGPFSGIE